MSILYSSEAKEVVKAIDALSQFMLGALKTYENKFSQQEYIIAFDAASTLIHSAAKDLEIYIELRKNKLDDYE